MVQPCDGYRHRRLQTISRRSARGSAPRNNDTELPIFGISTVIRGKIIKARIIILHIHMLSENSTQGSAMSKGCWLAVITN